MTRLLSHRALYSTPAHNMSSQLRVFQCIPPSHYYNAAFSVLLTKVGVCCGAAGWLTNF